jgi:hypothetical protein
MCRHTTQTHRMHQSVSILAQLALRLLLAPRQQVQSVLSSTRPCPYLATCLLAGRVTLRRRTSRILFDTLTRPQGATPISFVSNTKLQTSSATRVLSQAPRRAAVRTARSEGEVRHSRSTRHCTATASNFTPHMQTGSRSTRFCHARRRPL